MISDIELTLTVDETATFFGGGSKATFSSIMNGIKVVGASINYGVNKLPVATVHIASVVKNNSSSGLTAFCDFDNFKRNPVLLKVKTSFTCLLFKGIIDGGSITQQPGNLTASFVVKHVYALLMEVFPRLIGGNASTINKFALPQAITINGSVASSPYPGNNGGGLYDQWPYFNLSNQVLNQHIDMNMPAIRFIISLNSIMVDAQAKSNSLIVGGTEIKAGNFSQLVCALSTNAQSMAGPIKNLINTIDAQYTDGFAVYASDALAGTQIQNSLALFEDNMFQSLIRSLDDFGCCWVIANNKSFVIPNAPYLLPGLPTSQPSIGSHSTTVNVAFPADYTTINFNDMGENTIKGVFTISEPMVNNHDYITDAAGLGINGLYTEDLQISACVTNSNPPLPSTGNGQGTGPGNQVFGNIEIKTVAGISSAFMTCALFHKSAGLRTMINDGTVVKSQPNNAIAPKNSVNQDKASTHTQNGYNYDAKHIARLTDYLNQKAQAEYCRIKYGDRTGQINMPFNNNWAPGAPGSVYTRYPGMRIDFFVADVTHNFSINTPNTGNATTTVSFMGGRPGASINKGLPKLNMYNYTWANSQAFCSDFLTDLKSTTGVPVPPFTA